MINSTEKSKYPMKWRDTCASWCWCWKLSQQTGRDGFPRRASNRKRAIRKYCIRAATVTQTAFKSKGERIFLQFIQGGFLWTNSTNGKEAPTVSSMAFIPASKIICPAPRDTKWLSRIWDRLSNISVENETGIDVDILV